MSISVVYWSGTGNTKAMAGAVAEGIEEAGAGAEVRSVDQADADALSLLYRRWREKYPGKGFCFSVPMDGETANGCGHGVSGWRIWERC